MPTIHHATALSSPGHLSRPGSRAPVMQEEQWIAAFATCLLDLWPRLEPSDGQHVAEALWRDTTWRCLGPEEAAARWAMHKLPVARA